MNKTGEQTIRDAFSHGKAFIPFITCGDPDLQTTAACVREMVRSGADLIELGIPFSDPTAEGPVIQGANLRALTGGVTTDRIFEMVKELRRDVTVPLVFMTYANVVFSYGAERFLAACADRGINGLILPDLPFEEKEEFDGICREHGVDLGPIIRTIRENTDVPCAIGFGISNPEQARAMADKADGVIVGSAIVKLIAQHGKDAAPYVGAFVKEMKDAIR